MIPAMGNPLKNIMIKAQNNSVKARVWDHEKNKLINRARRAPKTLIHYVEHAYNEHPDGGYFDRVVLYGEKDFLKTVVLNSECYYAKRVGPSLIVKSRDMCTYIASIDTKTGQLCPDDPQIQHERDIADMTTNFGGY